MHSLDWYVWHLCPGHTLSLQSKASLSLWSTSGGMLRTVVTEHSFKGNLQNTFLILMHIIIRLISCIYIKYIYTFISGPYFFVKCKCHVVIGDIMMQWNLAWPSRNVAVALIASSAVPNGQLYAGVFQGFFLGRFGALRREILTKKWTCQVKYDAIHPHSESCWCNCLKFYLKYLYLFWTHETSLQDLCTSSWGCLPSCERPSLPALPEGWMLLRSVW